MKLTINKYQFERAFKELRPDNFTCEGLNALYEYFEGYEEDTGEEIELDVIAICCEWSEYENLKEFQNDYGEKYTLENIQDFTFYIPIENSESFLILQF